MRFVFGDQLSKSISSLLECNKEHDIIFMREVKQKATYVKHHKMKLAFIFSTMRHIARILKKSDFKTYRVDHS